MPFVLEGICNANGAFPTLAFESREALGRYLTTRGFYPTENIDLIDVIMLVSHDTEDHTDGESVELWVKNKPRFENSKI